RATADATPVVINLASEEYFKVVDRKALKPRVVTCVFEERKGDQYKVISFMAKRARGLMVRHAVLHRVMSVDELKAFDAEGYRYIAELSEPDRLVFRRDQGR
ncbi:MAG TPA: peroxide stress protein YaaA, partial [Burkholderiaceae bacterium]|nr:peroxide stress protein YaaA [Burkholderiaceae bacterium]